MDTKIYFMAVSAEEAIAINESLNKLNGYITGIIEQQVDHEHGPQNPTAELMLDVSIPIRKLTNAFSTTNVKIIDANKQAKEARMDMANDLISTINNNAMGLDLITNIVKTLENYAIIGREQFKGGKKQEYDEELPF